MYDIPRTEEFRHNIKYVCARVLAEGDDLSLELIEGLLDRHLPGLKREFEGRGRSLFRFVMQDQVDNPESLSDNPTVYAKDKFWAMENFSPKDPDENIIFLKWIRRKRASDPSFPECL